MAVSNRNLLFRRSIFRGYVSFREGSFQASARFCWVTSCLNLCSRFCRRREFAITFGTFCILAPVAGDLWNLLDLFISFHIVTKAIRCKLEFVFLLLKGLKYFHKNAHSADNRWTKTDSLNHRLICQPFGKFKLTGPQKRVTKRVSNCLTKP